MVTRGKGIVMAGRNVTNTGGWGEARHGIALRYTSEGMPVIDAVSLLGGSREARLLYGDTEYRLQMTANGKLILTK